MEICICLNFFECIKTVVLWFTLWPLLGVLCNLHMEEDVSNLQIVGSYLPAKFRGVAN